MGKWQEHKNIIYKSAKSLARGQQYKTWMAKMIYNRSTTLEWSVNNIFTGGLKLVLWYQTHHFSDVDQDK